MLTGLAGMASAAKPGNYCRVKYVQCNKINMHKFVVIIKEKGRREKREHGKGNQQHKKEQVDINLCSMCN